MFCILTLIVALGFASAAHAQATCTPGEQVPTSRPGKLLLSFFAARQNLVTDNITDGQRVVGDYALDLYKEVYAGRVPRWNGRATIRLLIFNTKELPPELPYLSGNAICQGMLKVEHVGSAYRVRLPIDGQSLAQASLILPIDLLVTPARNAYWYIEPTSIATNFPVLTAGPYEGRKNVLGGLQGEVSDTTRMGEAAARGDKFILVPLIMGKEGT